MNNIFCLAFAGKHYSLSLQVSTRFAFPSSICKWTSMPECKLGNTLSALIHSRTISWLHLALRGLVLLALEFADACASLSDQLLV